MTPERWRAVDAILKAALTLDPAARDAFVRDACEGDEGLRREAMSLLAAHEDADDDFLERPAAEALGASGSREAAPSMPERLARALEGRYEIERELGHGGWATVYLARDLRHDRYVALKVLREDIAAAVGAERFLEEIRVTARLQHPHILPLFDSGSADGLLWYAMPYVEGETLRARIAREGRLPVDEAVRIVREIADALDHAHRAGVVHRDVKPENVLLQGGRAGARAGAHALVADFGIALALEHAGGERLTRTGIMLGTPQYMAPEQAAGERAIDARADVYALGAILHEMLAGESPFAAPSQKAVLRRVLSEPPAALATRRADVPPFMDAAVRRALAKRPAERYASAAAFSAALAVPLEAETPVDLRGDLRDPLGDPLRGVEDEEWPPARDRSSQGRMVSARSAIYAAAAMLVIGLGGGWALARSPIVEGWLSRAPSIVPPVVDAIGRSPAPPGDAWLTVVDRRGREQFALEADRPWTPRFSPDGRRVAYGAFGEGRNTSDIWTTDLATRTTRRITDDDDGDANDPQWSPDGTTLAYSVNADGGKDIALQRVSGDGADVLESRSLVLAGTQFASDWLRDGSALLVTSSGGGGHDVVVQPADGSAARPYAATGADETAARVSPDGRWVAYTSDESGSAEVYLDSYPTPGRRVRISSGGGLHPVWRGDGRELYYWNDGALRAVRLREARGGTPPEVTARIELFRMPYHDGQNTMYDASPDGERFVIVRRR